MGGPHKKNCSNGTFYDKKKKSVKVGLVALGLLPRTIEPNYMLYIALFL